VKKMEIIGGMSLPREVRLYTKQSTVIAQCDRKTGAIASQARFRKKRACRPKRSWPLPQTVRLLLNFWNMSGWVGKTLILLWLFWTIPNPWKPAPTYRLGLLDLGFMISIMITHLGILMFIINRWTGTWHAAEHMAIAAWEKHRAYDFTTIAKQPPIHERCGGRFLLPLMIAITGLPFLLQEISLALRPWSMLIALELVLQIDRRIGYYRIPGFKQASVWLQRHFTTREPDAAEIVTAQTALIGLLLANQVITVAEAKKECPYLSATLESPGAQAP
jgi:hypothetical protein